MIGRELYGAFVAARAAALGAQNGRVVGRNAKRDVTRRFDQLADAAIRRYAAAAIRAPVRIVSEESGERLTRPGRPARRWVVDPVDGSENFSRALGMSGMAIAELPAGGPMNADRVERALLGDLRTGVAYLTRRGAGATTQTGRPVCVSWTRRLSEALVGCDLHFTRRRPEGRLLRLVGACKDIRRMGSTVVELMCVADGRYDAYVDIRGELTAEDFLAASLVVREAGGWITDRYGRDWGPIANLTQRFTVVAAGTKTLHRQLLKVLNG